MKTLCRWGGLARASGTLRKSHTTGMRSKVHPTYKTKYRVANWPAYNRALVRRGDVTVWLSSEAIAAALLGSRHRDRPDPATPLLSSGAPGRRVPARPVRDDAPRPLRPRLYDALPAQSASAAPSATGPARREHPSRARQHGPVHRRGGREGRGRRGWRSGRPRNTMMGVGAVGISRSVRPQTSSLWPRPAWLAEAGPDPIRWTV